MKEAPPLLRSSFWKTEFCSPKDLVFRALFVAALFGAAEVAGLREYTTFLSGTAAVPQASWNQVAFLGAIYLLLYFAFILAAPIFLLAAALLAGWESWRRRRAARATQTEIH
jgi:hypothetical protein